MPVLSIPILSTASAGITLPKKQIGPPPKKVTRQSLRRKALLAKKDRMDQEFIDNMGPEIIARQTLPSEAEQMADLIAFLQTPGTNMDPIEQTLEWEALSRKEFGPSAEDMGYDSDDDNDFEEELLNAPFNEYMDGAYGYSTESKYPIISSWDQFDKVVIGGSAEFSVCENPVAIDEHVEMSGGCDFAGTGYSAATTARDATVLRGLDLGRAWTLNADSEAVVSSSETCALERVMPELTLGVKCDLEKLNVLA